MDAKRQKIQLELAFMTEDRSETPMAVNKGTEATEAKREPEGFRMLTLIGLDLLY